MFKNKYIKILCSLPVLLICLYFMPFLGICLIIFSCFVYSNKMIKTLIFLLLCGLLILIPQIVYYIIKIFKINSLNILYLDSIIGSNIYTSLLSYSKLLITISIVLLILSAIFKNIFYKISNKLNSYIRDYIEKDLQKDYEIRKENDLKMQEKREKAKNTHIVFCPHCGSSTMLTEKTGTCSFCRREIEYKEK